MPLIQKTAGFTLIELMVTLAVVVVLLLIAVPSFEAFRQRAALRSAGDEALVLWNQARFEAAKRNTFVKFAYQASGSNYCLGAATTTDPADSTTCDCFTAGACNVAQFPGGQSEWRGVAVGDSATNPLGVVVIEPKRTFLSPSSAAGSIAFTGPPGRYAYKLYLHVDALGRAVLCEPSDAANKLSDYHTRTCTP